MGEARALVAGRLEQRDAAFLEAMRRGVYERPGSPYRALLALAGCEFGDVARLVAQAGVEGALHALYRAGVYLTVDEFKGRRPIVRGGRTVATGVDGIGNQPSGAHVLGRTSGSGGVPTPVPADLEFLRDRAVNSLLVLSAREGLAWRHATWGVPGSDALVPILRLAVAGARPARWFALVSAAAPGSIHGTAGAPASSRRRGRRPASAPSGRCPRPWRTPPPSSAGSSRRAVRDRPPTCTRS